MKNYCFNNGTIILILIFHSYQYCFMVMLEKLKESMDRGDEFSALFTDPFKSVDYIDPNLLIILYEETTKSLNLFLFFLRNRTQRFRTNKSYSNKLKLRMVSLHKKWSFSWRISSFFVEHVPHTSVLGLLPFNIDLVGLLLECEDNNIHSYAHDTTSCSYVEDMSSVINGIQRIAEENSRRFENNHMKANHGKCPILLSSNIKRVGTFDNCKLHQD